MNLSAVRAQFPFLEEYTYFNHSAIGPLSINVQAAVNEALTGQAQGSLGSPL